MYSHTYMHIHKKNRYTSKIEANGKEGKAQCKGSQTSPTCLDLTAPAVSPAALAVTQRSPNG